MDGLKNGLHRCFGSTYLLMTGLPLDILLKFRQVRKKLFITGASPPDSIRHPFISDVKYASGNLFHAISPT